MRFVTAIAILALSVVSLIATGLLVATLSARRMERQATTEWERHAEPMDAFRARFPATKTNASQTQLERLAVPLGVNIRPHARGTDAIADDDPRTVAASKVLVPIADYLEKEMESPSATIDEPPPDVAAFVNAHRDDLRAIEHHLDTADLPATDFDLNHLIDADVPNLLGDMKLSRLIATHVLVAQRTGQQAEAWDAVHAIARLSQSLDNQPVVITQLISIAMAKIDAALARRLSAPVPPWQEEFSKRDFMQLFLNSLVDQDLHMDAVANAPQVSMFGRSYLRMCAADALRVHAALLGELKKTNVCDLDAGQLESFINTHIASWNYPARINIPNFAPGLVRVRDVIVAHEMTEKVLAAKAARARAGTWPASMPGIQNSVCRGRAWNYEVSSDGTMTLAMDKPLVTKKLPQISVLPLSYRER